MSLEAVLRELGIPVAPDGHHHVTRGRVQIDCPWCSKDSGRFRLGINERGLYSTCWTCGSHKLVETLAEASGESYKTVRERFIEEGVEWSGEAYKIPAGRLLLPSGRTRLLRAHRDYLRGRGFSPKKIQKLWGVEGIGVASRLAWRIFIPIHYGDQIVSWTTRAISDKVRKRYHSAAVEEEAIRHKTLLYGEQYARHAIIVLEGPLDVWAVGPGAVGTCGTGWTKEQLAKMAKYPIRAICFDAEEEAQRRAEALCRELSALPGETFNILLETGSDAASAKKKEIRGIRRRFLE